MNKYKIKGDGNIVGNNNIQTINKTKTNVNKELVELIYKLANPDEQKSLIQDLDTLQDEKQEVNNKKSAGARIAKYLKTVAGEAGKVVLAQLMTSGYHWAEYIIREAQITK